MSKSNLGIMLMSLAVLTFVNCGNGNTSVSYESDRMSSSSIQDVADGSTRGDSTTGPKKHWFYISLGATTQETWLSISMNQ